MKICYFLIGLILFGEGIGNSRQSFVFRALEGDVSCCIGPEWSVSLEWISAVELLPIFLKNLFFI